MNDIFVYLLFGHLVGDFLLQNKDTAVRKGSNSLTCLVHVSIYTLAVLLFTIFHAENFSLTKYYLWVIVIGVPHYLIDRYSLADKYLKLINGRSLEDFFHNGHKNIPENIDATGFQWDNYRVLRGGFSCIVYVAVDFTFHFLCLWYGYKLIFG